MSASLFDSHCHLENERFAEDLADVLARMKDAHVDRCILAGSDMPTSEQIVKLAADYPQMYGVVGVHPHEAEGFAEGDLTRLAEMLQQPHILGVGEIGLDYFYDYSPRDVQKAVFARQLVFAHEQGVPAVFHIRDAHGDTLELLRAHRSELPTGVLHCYTGSAESAREYLDLGFNISFSGSVTFKNAHNLQEAARFVPLDRIMIETDSPYLAPVPMRGKRNEPTYVRFVAEKIAELREMPVDELIAHATANTEALYGLAQKA